MIDRTTVIGAVAAELDARAGQCREEHAAIGAAVADRLGMPERAPLPSRWVFVRRQSWISPELAARFGGAIICTRSSQGRVSLDREWCADLLARGGALAGWEWMLPPGTWRAGLEAEVERLASVDAVALVLNVEPASGSAKGGPKDWRGKHAEVAAYVGTARELCHAAGLELWVTSWARPSAAKTFPWAELIGPADRAIPQPYEVHGASGKAYVADVLEQWRSFGAREIILGRGAHELDDSDDDYWRTPAEIREHRRSTPPGMAEAWWLAGGTPPARVVDAIVAPTS